jgi:lipopolysaccharide export system protein LptA
MSITPNLISASRCKFPVKSCVLSLLFLFCAVSSQAQKRVEIVNANTLKSGEKIANGAKRLIGDVQFKQDDVLMFCDSAYFYKDNSLDAFGHVRIRQGDSLTLYGDLLKYNGNTRKAVLNKNVMVNKGDMQLSTDALNYDLANSVGYYLSPARIINKDNVLTSDQGYYYSESNQLNFKNNVVLTNPQFVINSDTMKYNTASKVTYFLGPTTIKSKENLIYCEDGWYDTNSDLSRFSKNSYIITEQQKMYGDSLYYDRNKGIGKAVKNVQIIDTTQNLNIKGDLALHYEFLDLSVVTGHALLMQTYEKDTLFMHADTLKAQGDDIGLKTKKTAPKKDSLDKKEADQRLYAYHHVKFFKSDLQGKCDSLTYIVSDSIMKLYGRPTLWNDENQLTADSIDVHTGEESLRSIELKGTGFIVSEEDSIHYNQIRGKYMHGFFRSNALYRVNVEGNGQTIYYAKEEEKIKAVNRADCSDLFIYLKENKIDRITFVTKPEATLFPLDKISPKELKLKDFTWRKKERPRAMKDIFTW